MRRTIASAMTLAVAMLSAACSSSSGGGADAGVVDAEVDAESDVTAGDASDEEAESSPVYGCNEAQLAFATSMACGQCVAQNCAALLHACTNCVLCEMQLSGCPACGSTCFARAGAGAGTGATLDAGP
jgi:hypothetical protein